MDKFLDKPIGQIVAENLTAAKVFEARGIDFCCHGNRTLENVCKAHHLAVELIEAELSALNKPEFKESQDINTMSLEELTQYIISTHHTYVKKALPEITRHLDAAVRVHGGNHPELVDIQKNFISLKEELELHLEKEENDVFPSIDALTEKAPIPDNLGELSQSIATLEQEHESAGRVFDHINELAQRYKAPADACNTYQLVFKELQELEQDLHVHIARENYLLFPKAIKYEKERMKK